MGFFRGGLLIFVSILLLVSLLGVNSLFVVSSSLEYDNVNEEIRTIVTNETLLGEVFPEIEGLNLNDQEEEIFQKAKEICGNETTDYVFSQEGYTIVIPCGKIQEGSEAVINETIDELVESIYYKNYDCNYWDCFTTEKTPLFLISEKSHDYWQEKMIYALVLSLILVVLMFLLVEKKQNFPIVLGSVLIVSALPLLKLESLIISLMGSFAKFFASVITNAKTVFWSSFVLGLILIGLGIALKIWGFEGLKKKFGK